RGAREHEKRGGDRHPGRSRSARDSIDSRDRDGAKSHYAHVRECLDRRQLLSLLFPAIFHRLLPPTAESSSSDTLLRDFSSARRLQPLRAGSYPSSGKVLE